jgi:hypothetical protein
MAEKTILAVKANRFALTALRRESMNFYWIAQMFSIRRQAAAGVTFVFHGRNVFLAHLVGRGATEFGDTLIA